MIIDSLIYLGHSHFGYSLEPAAAIAQMDRAGTDAVIAAPVHPHRGDLAAANDLVLKAASESGGRIVPLARADPWEGGAALAEIKRAVSAGARGLFLHPSEEHFRINDDAWSRPLVEYAAELAVPVVAAAGAHTLSEPLQLGYASQWAPGNPFVLTNGGQFNISGMAQFDALLALQNPNVHVHTSGMYRQDFLEEVVSSFGPQRLLFASAAPVFDLTYERSRVDLAHFSADERRLILGDNASHIFGIGVSR